MKKNLVLLTLASFFCSSFYAQESVFINETESENSVVISDDASSEENAGSEENTASEESAGTIENAGSTENAVSPESAGFVINSSEGDDAGLTIAPETSEEDPIVRQYLELQNNDSEKKSDEKKSEYKIQKKTVAPKRPKKSSAADNDKIPEKNSGDEYVKKTNDVFSFGLESEISEVLDELTKNEDTRFVDHIYDVFYASKNPQVRNKILSYFTKLKDPCLCDYAVDVINDPYDERRDTVELCFKYAVEVECKEAVPGLVDLVDKEEEDYFNGALSALSELGGSSEAEFLAAYLDRDDLTVAQRQSLMRALGKIKAVETWDKLSEIAQDENENSFVRMYAAEVRGAMEKKESEEILIKLFESEDPNFRVYVLKGLSHFKDSKTDAIVLQALRDSQYKVRLEAINIVKEREMKQAVPFLIYRAKHKSEEKVVKEKCWAVLAFLNTKEGNEYLISVLNDKKIADGSKAKVASCLLEENHAGTKEVIELARTSLKDDKLKNLRYSLGKEFAKYGRPEFEEICGEYIDHADVAIQGTGLDIWAKGRYSGLRNKVSEIAKDAEEDTEKPKKKKNANAAKAKRVLENVDSLTGKTSAAAESKSVTEGEPVATETTVPETAPAAPVSETAPAASSTDADGSAK